MSIISDFIKTCALPYTTNKAGQHTKCIEDVGTLLMPLRLTISLTRCRVDVTVAISFALVFCMLVIASCMTLYLRRFWVFLLVVCFTIFLSLRLKTSRQTLARKRERRLPLSIWVSIVMAPHIIFTGRQRGGYLVALHWIYMTAPFTSLGQKRLFLHFWGKWYSSSSQGICKN